MCVLLARRHQAGRDEGGAGSAGRALGGRRPFPENIIAECSGLRTQSFSAAVPEHGRGARLTAQGHGEDSLSCGKRCQEPPAWLGLEPLWGSFPVAEARGATGQGGSVRPQTPSHPGRQVRGCRGCCGNGKGRSSGSNRGKFAFQEPVISGEEEAEGRASGKLSAALMMLLSLAPGAGLLASLPGFIL